MWQLTRRQFINRTAVLGWLETLRQKKVAPKDEGESLSFDTDNTFHAVISKSTGMLEQLDGKSPTGEMHLLLDTVVIDKPIDASQFKVQEGVSDGREVSDDLRRSVTHSVLGSMRDGVYSTIASDAAGPAWDDATKARISAILRALHERSIETTLEGWHEAALKKRDGVAERLRKLAADGKSAEEVAKVRELEKGYLNKALDDMRTGFTSRLIVPTLAMPLPRGAELLALETEVVGKTFDETVRAPAVADFEQGTAPTSK